MSTIGVMGASGFVGSRLVEMFVLEGTAVVRPIVRGFGSLAGVARFDLDWRLAEACDTPALRRAFEGCDYVVHSVVGNPDVIERSIVATYRAAEEAGVGRIVYVSTASVHGQAPNPGTNERSVLSDLQAHPYNNAKVRAERALLLERSRGSVEVVILRPSIIYGPRDRWISTLAKELLSEQAYLVEEGKGISNLIYIDNFLHAIRLALTASGVDGEAILLGDEETVTWAELYEEIAFLLGVQPGQIHQLPTPPAQQRRASNLSAARFLNSAKALLPLIPWRWKRVVKNGLTGWAEPTQASPWVLPSQSAPTASDEVVELQKCSYKFPLEKATRLLGYKPEVSFQEGCRRSTGWLRFAGLARRQNTLPNPSLVAFGDLVETVDSCALRGS